MLYDDYYALLAGGNDNWKWQLRDADGRWIFMGGLARFFARLADGRIVSGVGNIVGITKPNEAIIRVDPKSGGDVPSGDYRVQAKNLTKASAIIPENTLRKLGIKFKPPADSSTIPNLSDMKYAGQSAASTRSTDDDSGSPSLDQVPNVSQVRDAGSAKDLPRVEVDGWDQVLAQDYLEEKQNRSAANLFDDIVKNRPDLVEQYKDDYGNDWEQYLRDDVKDEYQNFVDAQEEAFDNVDLYRLGNVTVAISKEFRGDPQRLKDMLDQIKNLRQNTRDIDKPIEITILANKVEGDEEYSGFARSTLISFVDQYGRPVYDRGSMSIIVDASVLLPSNTKEREDLMQTLKKEKEKIQRGEGTHNSMASYGGDVDTYVEYTITHEWGHMLDYAANPDTPAKDVQFGGEPHKAAELSGRLAALLEKNPWILALLSQYGQTNPYEAFAEIFAQVYMEKFGGAGIDPKIPSALRLFIEKYVL
jgi:hypothetical protein